MLPAVEQGLQIAEAVLFLAEHPAEIVACAGGEGGGGHVGQPGRAVDALVEGAVAAAGVDPQMLAEGRLVTDFLHRIHRRFRHIDLKLVGACAEGGLDLLPHVPGAVFSAGDGIDDKQVLHLAFLLSVYMKRSHLIMPL